MIYCQTPFQVCVRECHTLVCKQVIAKSELVRDVSVLFRANMHVMRALLTSIAASFSKASIHCGS